VEAPLPAGLVLAIFGPTGSGKTAVAEAVAARVPARVVSADSAALYRGLEVLTAAPGPDTLLVGVLELEQEASVVAYQRLAHAAIDAVLAEGRTPVVAGGTGLYLRAALSALSPPPAPQPGERERWERLYDRLGGERAHGALARRDPDAAARIHPNDRRRVVRALELAGGGSSLLPERDDLWSPETRLPTLVVGLELPREVLDRRLEARAARMVELGVQDEARAALARPLSLTASKVMGLREAAELPRDEVAAALASASRRLARYQRKWLRRLPGLVPVDADRPPERIAAEILDLARSR
jgi:tRNA dimethylallyltransferase